jgi:hypothetical protein
MKTKPEQFLFIVFLVISSISFGQAWDFHYDTLTSMGRKVIVTRDSNYLATGVNNEWEEGLISLKLDRDGNIIWRSNSGGSSVYQMHDGTFVYSGSDFPNGVIRKTYEDGSLAWRRIYGEGKQEEYSDIIESSDSTLVVCGYSHNHGDSTFFVMKTDASGNKIWSRSFVSLDHWGFRELLEFENHYYAVGRETDTNVLHRFLVIAKLTMSGAPRWFKRYELLNQGGYYFTLTQDSALLVTGGNLVIKMNTDGDTIWTRELFPYFNMYSIKSTPENGYILAGYKDYPDPVNMLVEYDEDGNRLWAKYYPTVSDPYWGNFESLQCAGDGGFVACGYSLYTAENITRLRVIKTDATGNIIVGTDEERGTRQTVIYPNPASRLLTVGQLDNWTVGQSAARLSIFDLYGREIKDLGKISSFPYHIDITGLPDGVYILRCTDEKGIYFSLKFLKIAE